MDTFKTRVGFSKIYRISPEIFERETGKRFPYVKKSSDTISNYAVCPECDNPIQLIGLYKQTKESGRKPYGKHHKYSISGLADYSEIDYMDCPFSNPTWKKTHGKKSKDSPLAKRLLELLSNQFDRITYLLNKQTGLYISYSLAEIMLDNYLVSEGWLFKEATVNNLPWLFAQCSPAFALFGKIVKKESPLYQALKDSSEVSFVPSTFLPDYVQVRNREQTQYLDLYITFLNHQKYVVNEEVTETMDFWVFKELANGEKETIFIETLPIESTYFSNLALSTKYEQRRNKKMLEISKNKIERMYE